MDQARATFNKDKEEIVQKFASLRKKADEIAQDFERGNRKAPTEYFEVRASALDLLARTAGENSIYYREILDNASMNANCMAGVLTAAMTDFREGFMADTKLLVSAEVFADFLVQAEVLLENDYKDAAAVISSCRLGRRSTAGMCLERNSSKAAFGASMISQPNLPGITF